MRVNCLFIIAAIFILSVISLPASQEDPKVAFHQLLERWENRDGAAFHIVGSEMSHFFAEHPSVFLNAMMDEPSSWRTWLTDLQYHTFTAFYGSQVQELESLLAKMEVTASKYSDIIGFSEIASELLTKLQSIQVREIE